MQIPSVLPLCNSDADICIDRSEKKNESERYRQHVCAPQESTLTLIITSNLIVEIL